MCYFVKTMTRPIVTNNGSCTGPLERVRAVDPSVHTVAVMIGEDLDHDTANSVFLSADHQVTSTG